MTTELWRVVKGHSRYEVSNLGQVRVIKTGLILRPDKAKVSTLGRVSLLNDGPGRRTLGVSTLMRDNWTWEWIKDIRDGEEFRECHGHPGYFISNQARVFSLHTYSWLETYPGHSYYWRVRVGGRDTNPPPVHTLVGRTFLDWQEGLLICHRDETLSGPEINWADNLYVGTWSDNNKDTWAKGRNHRG